MKNVTNYLLAHFVRSNFFPVLFSSHHYPSMVGALLCITVSCPVVFITVTPPLVKIADSTWVAGLCVDLVVELRNRFI